MIVSTVLLSILAQAAATQPVPARQAAPARPQAAQQQRQPFTKARVQNEVKAEFDRLDANHDGYVDKAEAQKGQASAVATRETRRQTELNQVFARLDANKDGTVSRAEFDALLPKPQMPANTPWITVNDTNKDGRVALAEVTTRALADFDRLDANHDGTITGPEIQAARRAAQQRAAAAPKK